MASVNHVIAPLEKDGPAKSGLEEPQQAQCADICITMPPASPRPSPTSVGQCWRRGMNASKQVSLSLTKQTKQTSKLISYGEDAFKQRYAKMAERRRKLLA